MSGYQNADVRAVERDMLRYHANKRNMSTCLIYAARYGRCCPCEAIALARQKVSAP